MQKLGYGSKEEKDKEELSKLLKILDNEVKDTKFVGGDTVGFVDFVSILVTYWLGVIQEALKVEVFTNDEFPNVCACAEELQSFPEKNYLELIKLFLYWAIHKIQLDECHDDTCNRYDSNTNKHSEPPVEV
ncbi:probable glutathione S-transferase [Lycium ferocissimum]|uniref:probable glutathione S-transferase n=1 Tax=Lycium ferocissimum TaxID=112874 RepID=UPI0028163D11|nr:probable glutathione S-transferase [Lycium ferocissimum]